MAALARVLRTVHVRVQKGTQNVEDAVHEELRVLDGILLGDGFRVKLREIGRVHLESVLQQLREERVPDVT